MARVQQGSFVPVLVEFVIAVVVGLLAVLGGVFVVVFLLVEPVMDPHGLGDTEPIELGTCDRVKETVSLIFAIQNKQCPNDTKEFTRYVCDLSHCTSANGGVCDESDRRCCCRSTATSNIDLTLAPFECNTADAGMDEEFTRSADVCSCVLCDDVIVTVTVYVESAANGDPIPAAQIFDTSTGDLLGLTLNDGTFRFNRPLEDRAVNLLIQAAFYMEQTRNIELFPPSPPWVNVSLSPTSLVAIGLGASSVILRLGDDVAISAPPQAFSTMEGETYNDLVFFNGSFMRVDQGDDIGGMLPNDSMQFVTNESVGFRAMQVFYLDFMDIEGFELSAEGLRITLSIPNEGGGVEQMDLFLVAFIDGSWVRVASFEVVERRKRKRQTNNPVVLSAPNVPIFVFVAVAASENIECFLHARTFMSDMVTAREGAFVELNQRSDIAGNEFLYTFGTNTGAQDPQLADHAICLPIACDDFTVATLVSRAAFDPSSDQLLPIDFNMSIFNMTELYPVAIGHIFSILEVVTATQAGSNRPFYDSSAACVASASTPTPVSADFFAFFTPVTPPAPPSGNCMAKIQILDCYETNRVSVFSFNIDSGVISMQSVITIDAIPEDILDLYDVGKTEVLESSGGFEIPNPAPNPADLTSCNATCATPRIACVPYTCTEAIQVLVQPPERILSPLCDLTGFSPILSADTFTGSSESTILLIDTAIILPDDFNDPNLGLYFDPDSPSAARRLCELGPLNNTQPVSGHAATFTCF